MRTTELKLAATCSLEQTEESQVDVSLERLVAQAAQLPSLSTAAIRLLELPYEGGHDINVLEKVITQDPNIASRVMIIANSPFYGLKRRVESLRSACMVLGFSVIRNLAMSAELGRVLSKLAKKPGHLDDLWQHSLGVAACAKEIAGLVAVDSSAAFTAGLFHDIGELLIAIETPERYAACRSYYKQQQCSLVQAEFAVLGFTHEAAGAALATHWGLPESLVTAIRLHENPLGLAHNALSDVVALANSAARRFGLGTPVAEDATLNAEILARNSLRADTVLDVRARAAAEYSTLRRD